MTWGHRIVRKYHKKSKYHSYGIYEVFYNENQEVLGFTENPVEVVGDTVEEIRETLQWMQESLQLPVLEYDMKVKGFVDDL